MLLCNEPCEGSFLYLNKEYCQLTKLKKKYICVKGLEDFLFQKKNNLQAMLTGYRCS